MIQYLVWVVRERGGHCFLGEYDTLARAIRRCRKLYRGYVTFGQSWDKLFSVGL